MKNYEDKSREIISGVRLLLIREFNACSSKKIFSNGNDPIDLFYYYDSNHVNDEEKMEKIVGCILELEGFEEANSDLSEKDRIEKLRKLEKKIRQAIQEV